MGLARIMRLARHSARLARWENLEKNMRSICALNVSLTRLERRLSLPALSAPSSLSRFSLTCAKCENAAKQAFEDRKLFLRLKLEKSSKSSKREANSERRKQNKGAKQSKEAKNLNFQEDLRFRGNF